MSRPLNLSLGPFYGAIAVPSVTRCRCCRRRRRRCGHRCAGGVRQWRRATVATPGEWQCGVRRLAVANGPNIFQMLLVRFFLRLVLPLYYFRRHTSFGQSNSHPNSERKIQVGLKNSPFLDKQTDRSNESRKRHVIGTFLQWVIIRIYRKVTFDFFS